MAEDNQSKLTKWFSGQPVDGVDVTWEQKKEELLTEGKDPESYKRQLIQAVANEAIAARNNTAVTTTSSVTETESSDDQEDSETEKVTETETESETDESGIPEYTADTDDATVNRSDTYRMGKLLFEKQEDGNFLVTDTETGEAGLYSMGGPTQNMRDAYLIRGTNNGHVLWNNRDLTGYRQENESTPGHMDYAPEWKTTREEAIRNATSGPEYDKALFEESRRLRQLQQDDPEYWTDERVSAELLNWKNQRIINANVDWEESPYGGGVDEGRISGTGGGAGGSISAPQLKPPPSFATQREWDQNIFDSLGAGVKQLMQGKDLSQWNPNIHPELQGYFGGSQFKMPTTQSWFRQIPRERENWDLMAANFGMPRAGEMDQLVRARWGGRKSGMGPASMYRPNVAARPNYAPRSSSSQTPFGFRPSYSPSRTSSRTGFRNYNQPSRMKSAAVRSGRDGLIRSARI